MLDLFALTEMPTQEMIVYLAASGFGCQFVSYEDVTITDDSGHSWQERTFYCSSGQHHPCGRFWLEIAVSHTKNFSWLISAGDIAVRTVHAYELEEAETSTSGGLRKTYAQRTDFYVESRASIEVERRGSSLRTKLHDIEPHDGQLCSWLARGSFFMGLNIESALRMGPTDVSEHEKIEWYKEKQLANVIYRVWAPMMAAREQEAFSSTGQWDRELGGKLIVAKGEMEKILGEEVSLDEFAKRFDSPIESIKRMMGMAA